MWLRVGFTIVLVALLVTQWWWVHSRPVVRSRYTTREQLDFLRDESLNSPLSNHLRLDVALVDLEQTATPLNQQQKSLLRLRLPEFFQGVRSLERMGWLLLDLLDPSQIATLRQCPSPRPRSSASPERVRYPEDPTLVEAVRMLQKKTQGRATGSPVPRCPEAQAPRPGYPQPDFFAVVEGVLWLEESSKAPLTTAQASLALPLLTSLEHETQHTRSMIGGYVAGLTPRQTDTFRSLLGPAMPAQVAARSFELWCGR